MSYVRLADRYAPVTIEQRVFLVDDDVFELEGASAAVGDALVSLKAGCKTSDIEAALGAEGSVLIKTLREHGMLRNRPISTSEHYQSRQIGLLDDLGDPTTLQQRFARSQIAIIGCGGIGAVAAQHLVGAGVGRLMLCDGDQVEGHNLNRQRPYVHSDIGSRKTEALALHLQRINPEVQIETVNRFLLSTDDIKAVLSTSKPDLVIAAADQPHDIEASIAFAATELRVAFITGSVGRHRGQWGPLLAPGLTCCPVCFISGERRREDPTILEIAKKLTPLRASFGPTNCLIADLLARDILWWLAGGEHIPSLESRCVFHFARACTVRSSLTVSCSCWQTL